MQIVLRPRPGIKLYAGALSVVCEVNGTKHQVGLVPFRHRASARFPPFGVPRSGDLFRPVSVVHVEVDDGDASRQATAVTLERVHCACRVEGRTSIGLGSVMESSVSPRERGNVDIETGDVGFVSVRGRRNLRASSHQKPRVDVGKRVRVIRATEDTGVVFDRRPPVAASPGVETRWREKRRERKEERFDSRHAPIMALLRMENPLEGAPAVAPSTPA